ncbi:MAG: HlyD family efflux transporter periplasmic adaptor subunit [Saprospiraceae bacterium]|nr:HlyD family efflux transporter periplasmic adaptor subunit [Saprospiraceae bacterium]
MLNISPNSVSHRVPTQDLPSFQQTGLSKAHRMLTRWLLIVLALIILFLMLPWTQNIQSKGTVTTLYPEQRPQTIPSTIGGRIEKWYVREGELVKKGDTIVFISEIKDDYFDPELIPRTEQQVGAKEGAIASYSSKVIALEQQIVAMRSELEFKQRQLTNKISQIENYLAADEADLAQAIIQDSVAMQQYNRTQELFAKDLKSRTDLEDKRVKMQETSAKVVSARNKLEARKQELTNARLDLSTVRYEYNQKIAKAESDKFSTLSERYDAEGAVEKLRIQTSNYERRSSFYYITAPQDCYITKAIKLGIGELVKEGDPVVSIMPKDYQLAVELYIEPMDLPLVNAGQEVRFIFDGWPAIVFSGWPGQSFGTFKGSVFAIDNNISVNNKYRILVAPDESEKPWPKALRAGSGAQGIALLNNVPLWYEIWRQLNGFPPDYYDRNAQEDPKLKAPVRSLK